MATSTRKRGHQLRGTTMKASDDTIYVEIGGESETTIAQMTKDLTAAMAAVQKGSLDYRFSAALLEMMPGFIKALDAERKRCVQTREALSEHLQVMSLPIANMLASVAMTMFPCEDEVPCASCSKMRKALVLEMMENIGPAVLSQVGRSARFIAPTAERSHADKIH